MFGFSLMSAADITSDTTPGISWGLDCAKNRFEDLERHNGLLMFNLTRLASVPYSGRGMFGHKCVAFLSLEALLTAVRVDHILPVGGWLTDSMGLGTIWYNPSLDWPIDNQTSQEDDDGEPWPVLPDDDFNPQ